MLHLIRSAIFARVVLLCCPVAFVTALWAGIDLNEDEELLLLPGIAHRTNGGRWVVRLRGYVYEPEVNSRKRRALLAALRGVLDVSDEGGDRRLLNERARLFLVDHERGKRVWVNFLGRVLYLTDSRANGRVRGAFLLPGDVDPFREMLQRRRNLRVPFFGDAPDGRRFGGTVHVIDDVGVSVISDIDDTIKISEVLNKEALVRRTFLQEFEAVPGLAGLYARHARAGHAFHYVSGSPWQLFPVLRAFVDDAGFPEGSFHLRELRLKSVLDFIGADPLVYKIETISELFDNLPRREFVLIGDSGEKDPEVYTEIAHKYRRQVRSIFIRDVRAPGEITRRIEKLRAKIPGVRFVVFRDAAEIESVRF